MEKNDYLISKDPEDSKMINLSPNNTPELVVDNNKKKIKQTNSIKKYKLEDFETSIMLGRGSYGKVLLAKCKENNKNYALKVIDKKFIEKQEKVHEVHIEKHILSLLDHPNIIKLYSTFQDKKKLYFILDYSPNRDLGDFIRSQSIYDVLIR